MKIVKEKTNAVKYEEIKIRTPKVRDYILAERVAGNNQGIRYSVALLSQICTFDGQQLPAEMIEEMDGSDFLELSGALMDLGSETLENQ
nr:hypothetical protein 3 [bacterium]